MEKRRCLSDLFWHPPTNKGSIWHAVKT